MSTLKCVYLSFEPIAKNHDYNSVGLSNRETSSHQGVTAGPSAGESNLDDVHSTHREFAVLPVGSSLSKSALSLHELILGLGVSPDAVENYLADLTNLIETGFDLYFEDLRTAALESTEQVPSENDHPDK